VIALFTKCHHKAHDKLHVSIKVHLSCFCSSCFWSLHVKQSALCRSLLHNSHVLCRQLEPLPSGNSCTNTIAQMDTRHSGHTGRVTDGGNAAPTLLRSTPPNDSARQSVQRLPVMLLNPPELSSGIKNGKKLKCPKHLNNCMINHEH